MQNVGGTIVRLLNQVDQISHDFVFHGYQGLVSAYSPAIYGFIVLSVIVFGYATLQGWVSLSMAEVSKRALLIGFILSLAMNWGNFSAYIYDLFTIAPNQIAGNIVQSISGSPFSDINSANTELQQTWYDSMKFVGAIWESGGMSHPLPYLWAALLLVVSFFLVTIAVLELVVAKFGMAIYLVLAPLILPLLLFKATKEAIFDGWFRHLVAFAFIPIFITSTLALVLLLIKDSGRNIDAAINTGNLTITVIGPYIVYSMICTGLLFRATAMAANMANGFAMGMAPQMMNGANSVRNMIIRNKKPSVDNSLNVDGKNNQVHVHQYSNDPSPR